MTLLKMFPDRDTACSVLAWDIIKTINPVRGDISVWQHHAAGVSAHHDHGDQGSGEQCDQQLWQQTQSPVSRTWWDDRGQRGGLHSSLCSSLQTRDQLQTSDAPQQQRHPPGSDQALQWFERWAVHVWPAQWPAGVSELGRGEDRGELHLWDWGPLLLWRQSQCQWWGVHLQSWLS